ncbi:hypothetical protein PHLGIDRAFT_506983 [Phlebiopsis gigantea 11061_1 CR5-6]|uniref:RING-type E3 ubiquitin transferase n=1 Tax=Phlebiopsis gigantea (strain 11061_1 CR5-6) TaxID=745531 RepID=A0A0C3PPI3_PHLG1|nr:hypothetical protein PHLGIDRAFT_506983 [Phlebiopsis gigantea 11061_1 CR5-6]
MSTQAVTQNQTRGTGQRGRKGSRARGGNRGGRGGKAGKPETKGDAEDNAAQSPGVEEKGPAPTAEGAEAEGEDAVCWICAEPVKYYALSECGHRTCHVCALRLRALYKKTECTFCKETQKTVVFTISADAPWSSYDPSSMPYKDAKLSILFETQEMMEDSLVLLRFNCPESTCDHIANGWSDLKLHTRGTHGKVICDLCVRFKKIFAHEHTLYTPNQLPVHLPSLQRGHRQTGNKDKTESDVHPLCEFCRECLFGEDELFKHMREKHEECFICKRNEVKDQYFRNWDALEQHFAQAHFPCTYASCQAQKFVVFGSGLDLKAHMVEVHGSDMSARDMKDARRIQADFEFEEVSAGGRRGGRRDRGDREHEREPPPHAGPSRANPAGARRREAFGGNLTSDNGPSATPPGGVSRIPSRRQSPSPDMDPAVAERYSALLTRVSAVAPNPNGAIPAVKSAVRSYQANESAARDLISTIWNVSDNSLEGTAAVINALVEYLEEEEKKKDLLQAWNGFKIEQRNQFPELAPSGSGTQWAGITSGRLLTAKQTTSSRSAHQSSGQVLDRVARAAASSSRQVPGSAPRAPAAASAAERFPPLQAASTPAVGGYRQPQRSTPWASASAAAVTPAPAVNVIRGPTSVPGPAARTNKAPGPSISSKSAFPELPSSSSTRVPKAAVGGNQSLRNILGNPTPPAPVWDAAKNGSSGAPAAENAAEPVQENNTGKGKKGKGKQKQTLFTLGSFPA